MAKLIYRLIEIWPFGTNCYLVGSESTRDGTVIDPAGEATKIQSSIKELGLRIGVVVFTHTHPDHIGAAKDVAEATGAIVAMHAAEANILQNHTYGKISAHAPEFKSPPAPSRLLKDGDTLEVGDLALQVWHTPGHSAGGICIAGYGVVFSGDTLFCMGIGRTDFSGGDHKLLISSIRNKLLTLPDQTVVLPGHGPKTTIGRERQSNPFLR